MQAEKKEKYLLISDEGVRSEFTTTVEKSKELFALIGQSGFRLVLLDYRKVHFRLPKSDAFNLVRYYEQRLPSLSDYIIAAVVGADDEDIALIWSEISFKRGFPFKSFTDINEAERWLLKQY